MSDTVIEVLEAPETVEVISDTVEILEPDGSIDVVEIDESVEVLETREEQVIETGPAGATGQPGADGVSGGSHVHPQVVAASVWTVNHNLGYRPGGIVVEDSAGDDWIGFEVHHVDENTLTLTFGGPAFGGLAYLS